MAHWQWNWQAQYSNHCLGLLPQDARQMRQSLETGQEPSRSLVCTRYSHSSLLHTPAPLALQPCLFGTTFLTQEGRKEGLLRLMPLFPSYAPLPVTSFLGFFFPKICFFGFKSRKNK